MRERWAAGFELLNQIEAASADLGAGYSLVIHPDRVQVDGELQREIADRFGLNLEEFDLELPQRTLAEHCASHGTRCLDLLPALRARGRGGILYGFRDTHYNSAGDALVARAIAHFLRTLQPRDRSS